MIDFHICSANQSFLLKLFFPPFYSLITQNVAHRPEALASPVTLSELRNLRPRHRLSESESAF